MAVTNLKLVVAEFAIRDSVLVDVRRVLGRRRGLAYCVEEMMASAADRRGQISVIILLFSCFIRVIKLLLPAWLYEQLDRFLLRQAKACKH